MEYGITPHGTPKRVGVGRARIIGRTCGCGIAGTLLGADACFAAAVPGLSC